MRSLLASAIALISLLPFAASAHVVVSPESVGVASFQTFTVSVPSEKAAATTGVRLLVPSGLTSVTPTVKNGWQIAIKKDADGNVMEISWTGGRIPMERRDEFSFSARVPAEEMKLVWKAYQSYADGSVVAWDMDPNHDHEGDFSTSGPYSVTKVVDDIAFAPGIVEGRASEVATFALAVAALATAGIALSRTRKRHHA